MKNILKIFLSVCCSIISGNVKAQQVADPATNKPVLISPNLALASYPNCNNIAANESKNEIRTWIPDVPTQQYTASGTYYRQQKDYFDGLGRPFQTVNQKSFSGIEDMPSILFHHLGQILLQYFSTN